MQPETAGTNTAGAGQTVRLYTAGAIDRYQTAGAGQKRSTAGHIPESAQTYTAAGIRSRYRAIYPTDTAGAIDRSADKLTAGTVPHNQNNHDRARHPRQEQTAEA